MQKQNQGAVCLRIKTWTLVLVWLREPYFLAFRTHLGQDLGVI